uniref:Uncharacterized protein n=1 Tax=Otarine gammaherpesvirus 4 TaxID=2801541 RepID=A0A889IW38_9GAMA|nr:hypothetical protein [Otarine gammaherpesvirus 4]
MDQHDLNNCKATNEDASIGKVAAQYAHSLGMCPDDLAMYALYGSAAWPKGNTPNWVDGLQTARGFQTWLRERVSANYSECNGSNVVAAANALLVCYLLAAASATPHGQSTAVSYISSKCGKLVQTTSQLTRGFSRLVRQTLSECLGMTRDHSIVKLSDIEMQRHVLLRKRNNASQRVSTALSVPAPSQRLGPSEGFWEPGSLNISLNYPGDDDTGLLHSLCTHAKNVPCGNPFDAMVAALVGRTATGVSCVALPADLELCEPTARDVGIRVLSRNVLTCLVRVPLLHPLARARATILASHQACARAIICSDCGHCLNFGKGRFTRVNFKPTQIFYCRDQKEKQCAICTATGRIYCSYCGSPDIREVPLVTNDPSPKSVPRLLAVLANNAALMLASILDEVDVVLPCLGGGDESGDCVACGAPVLKRLTVIQLLYLTSVPGFPCCPRCQHT